MDDPEKTSGGKKGPCCKKVVGLISRPGLFLHEVYIASSLCFYPGFLASFHKPPAHGPQTDNFTLSMSADSGPSLHLQLV